MRCSLPRVVRHTPPCEMLPGIRVHSSRAASDAGMLLSLARWGRRGERFKYLYRPLKRDRAHDDFPVLARPRPEVPREGYAAGRQSSLRVDFAAQLKLLEYIHK